MKNRFFTSYDNTFCNLETCKKKEKCIRWIGHYPQWKNHPRLSMLLIDKEEDCNIFTSVNMVTYLEDILGGRK